MLIIRLLVGPQVRTMLHKSKLSVAQMWAIAYAESEDFRKVEIIFDEIEAFRTSMEIRASRQFENHFPDVYRPAMYAWLASAEGGQDPQKRGDLQWFLDELAHAEDEQLRMLPHILGLERANKMRSMFVSMRRHLECIGISAQPTEQTSSIQLPSRASQVRLTQATAVHAIQLALECHCFWLAALIISMLNVPC